MPNSNRRAQEEFKFAWTGPTAGTLRNSFEKPAPKLFVLKAIEIRIKSGISGPPFDPYEYADALGIAVREAENMPVDGLLNRTTSGEFVIHLKKEVGQFRKNFTLAHELAHTFFYDHLMEKSPRFRGSSKADPEEEALCNFGASELLMPRLIFRRDLRKYRQGGLITPTTLTQLANRYQVSLQAVAIRAVTTEKDVSCAMWEKTGRAINVRWIAAKGMDRLVLCQTGKSSIEMAFRGPPGEVITANDSFYRTGDVSRRIIRKTLSQKTPKGFVFSVLLPRNQSQKPVSARQQSEVSEYWWQRD